MKVQAGSYKARAMNGDFGTSKSKGTSYVRVGFQILEGPFAGSTVTWDGWITDKTRQRVVDSLAYCGCTFPGDDITNLDGLGAQEVEIVVEEMLKLWQEMAKDPTIIDAERKKRNLMADLPKQVLDGITPFYQMAIKEIGRAHV